MIRAAAAFVAVLASFTSVYALCRWCGAQPQPAVVAALLAVSLSHRASPASRAHAGTATVTIAGIALAAAGVGWLLHTSPALGALVFTAAMFFSIWLRNFGERARSAGALIALPLVALLVVPAQSAGARGGPLVDLALVASAGVISLAYVTVIQSLARRAGIQLFTSVAVETATPTRPKGIGISSTTRMALQMAVALTAAFAVGLSAFPAHSGWTVLTAFIVCSGARGRGDAAYKGVLRLFGALTGTLAAAALARLWAPSGVGEAIAIFSVLFFGLWLRDVNYAFWAACMTLILALLARTNDGLNIALLGVRLEAMLVGALCAVAAAWFVLPIRTEAVVRRRLADALEALDDLVAHAHVADAKQIGRAARFEHRMAELDRVAPPVRWHRRIFASAGTAEHPARWIELTCELGDHGRAFASNASGRERQRAVVRRAIGASRRALANHGKPDTAADRLPVSVALSKLRDTLVTANTPNVSLKVDRDSAGHQGVCDDTVAGPARGDADSEEHGVGR